MKKLLSIALVALAGSVFADEVGTGSTEIGVTIIQTTKKNTIVPVAFASLTDGASAIGATNLVKVVGLPGGTILYAFNNGSYSAWSIVEGAWKAMTSVAKIDGVTISAGDDTATFVQGSAIWVVLPEAPKEAQNICIYGAYTAGATSPIAAGLNLVANPLQKTASFTFDKVTAGDQIIVPNDDGVPTIYTYNGAEWKYVTNDGVSDYTPSFGVGVGFWYNAKNAGTMSWE